VSDAVQEIVNDPSDTNNGIFHLPVPQEEIRDQLRLLKTGKAPGPDGIVNEHLKYAGHSLTIHLCRLFNLIIECEYMPHIFNLGHVLPIHKGKGKSKHDPSNYRGITLTSAIAKLFEKIFIQRIDKYMTVRNPSFPHPMRMGFRKHLGAQMASFILTETIQYYRESSTDIYTAFLDNEKAFDRVWLDGLLFKLSKIGITGKPWRILRNMYYNMYSCVSYAGHKSPPFKVIQHPGFQVRRLRTLTLVTSAEWRIFKEKKHGDNEHVFSVWA
jgi:hypothetical protein